MNLPKPEIERDTAMELWIREHSDYAKEQLVLNNVGIVTIVLKKLNLSVFDEDLFSTGLVGLVKAVNTFDASKGFKFSAYATQVVQNEIFMSFRKKRLLVSLSLDDPYNAGEENEILYRDMIADGKDFEEEIVTQMHFNQVMGVLSKREKQVIFLRLDGKNQNQIAKICGISQAQVSRISKRACDKFKEQIKGGIDFDNRRRNGQKNDFSTNI